MAECSVSFEELKALLEEVGRFADTISSGPNTLEGEDIA
jgi:hypothetical protein